MTGVQHNLYTGSQHMADMYCGSSKAKRMHLQRTSSTHRHIPPGTTQALATDGSFSTGCVVWGGQKTSTTSMTVHIVPWQKCGASKPLSKAGACSVRGPLALKAEEMHEEQHGTGEVKVH